MKEDIKYIHIMTHSNITHNGTVINMINDESLPFQSSDHTFIIVNKLSYECFKHYKNVYLNENIVSSNMEEFNYYANKSSYIFLHCNNLTYAQIFRIDKNNLRKIIWCVWGEHYLYPPQLRVKGLYKQIRRVVGSLLRRLASMRIKKFHAIGIGFKYDAIAVRKRFGDIRILPLPYGYRKGKMDTYNRSIVQNKVSNDTFKIMIGHSAHPYLHHKKILKLLYKFKDENILISLILSYGDMEYAKEIQKYAVKLYGNKVEILKDYMSPEEYFKYLNTIDISILDYVEQAALGNLWMLLYLEKKLFLNEYGILKLATSLEAVETYNVSEIEKMNFEEFVSPTINTSNGKKLAEYYINENNYFNMWYNTIKELI